MFRAADIADIVKSLNPEQQDVLMKYLYAGLGKPELYNSSVLLTWHEKARNFKRERDQTIDPFFFFYLVDRSCWKWLYCSCHDR